MNLQQTASAIREASAGGAVSLARVPGVYPDSVKSCNEAFFCLVRTGQDKRLAVAGPPGAAADFEGTVVEGVKICELDAGNAAALREAFPWTAPVTIGRRASFGTGDRLGVCTPGHLRAFSRFEIFPVLAQQSMRELGRTGRTPRQVIDDAGWGAFEAGYAGTFAADADHIKRADEAVTCYRLGFTMFTIDASDQIDLKAVHLGDNEALEQFEQLGGHQEIRDRYLGKSWSFGKGGLKFTVGFSAPELARCALVYHRAVEHMALVYRELSAAAGNSVEGFDFEVSVDETETDTTVRDHLFVAGELKARGVAWQSLAPKFTGQFQKGIDYIGDLDEFERQFAAHALLAEKLGPYKVSVHSGSDKFSIFPLVGKHTGGFFHLKTAGTSWLEAVRVIAAHRPELYREMHRFALENFGKDRASYHVTTDLDSIPEVGTLADSSLPSLMEKVDSRQLLHITYGSLLSARDESGEYLFRDRIFRVLYEREEDLYSNLDRHIGRHLETLGTAAK